MSGIAGLRGTGNWGADERPKNFRETIQWMSPNGMSPIFGLTSKAGKKIVDDPEFNFWIETQVLVRLQLNGAVTSAATQIVVDSADPSSSDMTLNFGAATNLKPGDILMKEPATDNTTYNPEFIRVEEVLSDTVFTVTRGVGGSTPAAMTDDHYLLLVGSAYAEGTPAPRAVARNPVKFNNYTQIFKDSYEITGTADATTARTGSAWSNDKRRKMFDHARAIEMAMIFGRKSETASSTDNGKPIRTMGGLLQLIPTSRKTVLSSAVTFDGASGTSFLNSVYKVFDFESPAGDTRIGFCGNAAMNALNVRAAAATNVRLNMQSTVKVYGTEFREFIMPQGRLLMRTHPLLNIQGGIYANSMLILDFDSIKYVALKGRDTKPHDDVQAKDEDVRRGYIQTECSLMLDRGGLTCGYVGNIVAA